MEESLINSLTKQYFAIFNFVIRITPLRYNVGLTLLSGIAKMFLRSLHWRKHCFILCHIIMKTQTRIPFETI